MAGGHFLFPVKLLAQESENKVHTLKNMNKIRANNKYLKIQELPKHVCGKYQNDTII